MWCEWKSSVFTERRGGKRQQKLARKIDLIYQSQITALERKAGGKGKEVSEWVSERKNEIVSLHFIKKTFLFYFWRKNVLEERKNRSDESKPGKWQLVCMLKSTTLLKFLFSWQEDKNKKRSRGMCHLLQVRNSCLIYLFVSTLSVSLFHIVLSCRKWWYSFWQAKSMIARVKVDGNQTKIFNNERKIPDNYWFWNFVISTHFDTMIKGFIRGFIDCSCKFVAVPLILQVRIRRSMLKVTDVCDFILFLKFLTII